MLPQNVYNNPTDWYPGLMRLVDISIMIVLM